MVIAETLTALGYGAKDLFMYNRRGYMFNRTQTQERDYHLQMTRIDQVKLYRHDIQDLFRLTSQKMDHYLILSTLGVLSTLGNIYNGRVPIDIPAWLFFLWAASSATSLMFMLTSVWFSIHGSVAAQIAMTRVRTLWLRLPVPRFEQILGAHGEDFEVAKTRDSLRFPLVEGARDDQPLGVEEDYTLFSGHFEMYQQLYAGFQGYDAFARISLVVGTQQFLAMINYVGLTLYLLDNQLGAWAIPVIATSFSVANSYMNLLVSPRQVGILAGLLILGMVLPGIATTQWLLLRTNTFALYVGPAIILVHMACLSCFIAAAYFFREGGLPTLYSTVLQTDVLGSPGVHGEEATLADVIPEAYLIKKSKAISHRRNRLGELKERVASSISRSLDTVSAEDIKLESDRVDKVESVGQKLNDLPANSFYFISAVSMFIWLAGLVVSVCNLSGVDFEGWDNSPVKGVLPSTGEYMG